MHKHLQVVWAQVLTETSKTVTKAPGFLRPPVRSGPAQSSSAPGCRLPAPSAQPLPCTHLQLPPPPSHGCHEDGSRPRYLLLPTVSAAVSPAHRTPPNHFILSSVTLLSPLWEATLCTYFSFVHPPSWSSISLLPHDVISSCSGLMDPGRIKHWLEVHHCDLHFQNEGNSPVPTKAPSSSVLASPAPVISWALPLSFCITVAAHLLTIFQKCIDTCTNHLSFKNS